MATDYSYDEQGVFFPYFILTITSIVTLPLSYSLLKPSKGMRPNYHLRLQAADQDNRIREYRSTNKVRFQTPRREPDTRAKEEAMAARKKAEEDTRRGLRLCSDTLDGISHKFLRDDRA